MSNILHTAVEILNSVKMNYHDQSLILLLAELMFENNLYNTQIIL